ncbi:unannotated protein [freshwater metagenome]|uniref:Unannotated protein n=1 Tax=freshwater metagenome TaxID=449393 RepID=A0A6J7EDN8_9ZZZZ
MSGGAALWHTAGDERRTAVRSQPSEQRLTGGYVCDECGGQTPTEHRGDGALEARRDLKLIGEPTRAAGRGRVCAQELVCGGQISADASRLAARLLGSAFGGAERRAGSLTGFLSGREHQSTLLENLGGGCGPFGCGANLLREPSELALERGGAVSIEARELSLQRLDPLTPNFIGTVPGRLLDQDFVPAPVPIQSLGERLGRLGGALQAQLDAIDGATRSLGAVADPFATLGPLRELALGDLATGGDRREVPLHRLERATGRNRLLLCGDELCAPGAQIVSAELPARLKGLALEALVQFGGLGLALERLQPRAGFALDIQCTVEILLRAIELELRAAATLAVLAEPGRLLDQQPAVARLGGDDRLDAALRDDRVHLLAQTGIGEHLEHVDKPAARAVESVLALAVAVEAAEDRELSDRQVDVTVAVIEHDLDLGAGARLHAVASSEDHVLHRLSPYGQR